MPSFFNRPRRLSPDFIAVPAEPSGRDLVDEAKVIELDELIYKARRQGDMELVDVLIDDRNAIRPPAPATVPVIPGRPS